jgi:hypothetical protein
MTAFLDGLFNGDAAQIAPLFVRQAELVPGCVLASEMTVQGIPYQNSLEDLVVPVFLEDSHPRVGAIEHVVNQAAVIPSSRSSHGAQPIN